MVTGTFLLLEGAGWRQGPGTVPPCGGGKTPKPKGKPHGGVGRGGKGTGKRGTGRACLAERVNDPSITWNSKPFDTVAVPFEKWLYYGNTGQLVAAKCRISDGRNAVAKKSEISLDINHRSHGAPQDCPEQAPLG